MNYSSWQSMLYTKARGGIFSPTSLFLITKLVDPSRLKFLRWLFHFICMVSCDNFLDCISFRWWFPIFFRNDDVIPLFWVFVSLFFEKCFLVVQFCFCNEGIVYNGSVNWWQWTSCLAASNSVIFKFFGFSLMLATVARAVPETSNLIKPADWSK